MPTFCVVLMAILAVLAEVRTAPAAETFAGTGRIAFAGYRDCILLENDSTRVVLNPDCGGRVLAYSWRGRNAMMRDSSQDGWTYTPGGKWIDPCGGRFDIGPEMTTPRHPVLWLGTWTGTVEGPRKARLVSQADPVTGVQLVREFELAARSSHLRVTQTIRNVSKEARSYCHWGRTLARPGGICIVPLTPPSRFPMQYIMYGPGAVMNYRPDDPHVQVRDGFLVVTGLPAQPKLGIDSYAGWLAYLMPEDLLFVKRFPTYPNRVYGEMAGLTISLYDHPRMCELEPIGPMERIEPGQSVSFTEDWWLLDAPFPTGPVDLKKIQALVDSRAR